MYEMMEKIHNDRQLRLIGNKIDEMIQAKQKYEVYCLFCFVFT